MANQPGGRGTRKGGKKVGERRLQASGRNTPDRREAASLTRTSRALDRQVKALGKEPHKPSTDSRYYGKSGKAGASREARDHHDAEVKVYNSWRRKYSGLKKKEVEASNAAYYARKKAKGK